MSEPTSSADDMLDAIESAEKHEWLSVRNDRLEESLVKQILSFFGLQRQESCIRRDAKDMYGKAELSFPGFYSRFQDFPMLLGARQLADIHKLTRSDLRDRFTRTRPYWAINDVREQYADVAGHSPIGVVFRWPDDGTMVLHDFATLEVLGYRESWTTKGVGTLFLDLLCDKRRGYGLLPAIAAIWQPEVWV